MPEELLGLRKVSPHGKERFRIYMKERDKNAREELFKAASS